MGSAAVAVLKDNQQRGGSLLPGFHRSGATLGEKCTDLQQGQELEREGCLPGLDSQLAAALPVDAGILGCMA